MDVPRIPLPSVADDSRRECLHRVQVGWNDADVGEGASQIILFW